MGAAAGRCRGATAEMAVPFPSVARRSKAFESEAAAGYRAPT
jgi:hypothetical protein